MHQRASAIAAIESIPSFNRVRHPASAVLHLELFRPGEIAVKTLFIVGLASQKVAPDNTVVGAKPSPLQNRPDFAVEGQRVLWSPRNN
jgi:hypothetical protein